MRASPMDALGDRDFLSAALDALGQGIALIDGDDRLLAWNARFVELLRPAPAVLQPGLPFADLWPRALEAREMADPAAARQLFGRMRGERGRTFLWQAPHGVVLKVRSVASSQDGVVGCFERAGVAQGDETARQSGPQALSAIMNSVPDGVVAFNRDGIVVMMNAAAERLFGYSVTEATLLRTSWLLAEPYRTSYPAHIEAFLETGEMDFIGKDREAVGKRKDGSTFPLELSIDWCDNNGEILFVGICRDITQRKTASRERERLEQELAQSQKLDALGTLAGGIAHEINTPTQYVGDNIRFLQESFADIDGVLRTLRQLLEAGRAAGLETAAAERAIRDSDLDFLLEEIPAAIAQSRDGVQRISEIVLAIKEFSHPDTKLKTGADINRLIETALTVSRNQWKYVAEVDTDFAPQLPPVPCLPGQINQVMLNLITNASHAIEEARRGGLGRITISTRHLDGFVEVRIADTGAGIAPDDMARIFDPFFTTKPPGKGTGQGLAICHNIVVQKHGGSLAAESEEGKGATLIVRLPAEPLPEDADPGEAETDAARHGTCR